MFIISRWCVDHWAFSIAFVVCAPAVYMYTCTINGGDLSAVDVVYGWKVKGEIIHLHLIINPKSTCSCSAISFFPNQDGVVWYFF